MQRDDEPPRGAQAAEPSPSAVLASLQLSGDSEAQITSFVESLSQGISGPRFRKLLTYVLKFVEHNRSKYEQLKTEQSQMFDQAVSTRDELSRLVTLVRERLPALAPVQGIPAPPELATQPVTPAVAPLPMPSVVTAPASQPTPSVSHETPAPPGPAPSVSHETTGIGSFSTLPPAVRNLDGTVSRRMDQVGNNALVTFSGDDDAAGKKAKLFGASAKYDIFTGQDMSQFPEWVAQFLSGINLFQPTEPNACKIALQLMRGKAAEMSKNVSLNVTMLNLQELLTALDRIFNSTGNRTVAVGLFNSFVQREDLSVQDYSIRIEQLFYRAYPGHNPDNSIFLMDRFINGLVSMEVKQRLRIPPQPSYFREAVEKAMSLTAAIYHSDQILKQKSMAWKMAASTGNPLDTRTSSRNPRGSLQMIEVPEDTAATVQTIRKWCTLHKTDRHSNADCRVQKESTANNAATTSKKRPKGKEKRKTKPRKLKFKSSADKKKFLRSIEDTEGVSLESTSSDDDDDVVEQSLMQIENASGEDDEEGDFHILMLAPDLLNDHDVTMDSVLFFPNSNFGAETQNASSQASIEGENNSSLVSTKAEISPLDTIQENTSMNTPVVSVPPFKEEENPYSPDLDSIPLDEDMFPSLEGPDVPMESANPAPSTSTSNYIILGGVYYQQIPPPHNVVVSQSSIPLPALVPVNNASSTPMIPTMTPAPVVTSAPSVVPSEVPLPVTDHETEDKESESSKDGITAAAEIVMNPGPKQDKKELATPPAALPSTAPSQGSVNEEKPSRPRSISSSSRLSNKNPEAAPKPMGVAPSDSGSKKIRGVGRGKNKAQGLPTAPTTPVGNITTPRENLRITVPASGGKRQVEIIPNDFPANIQHLANLEDYAFNRWDLQLPATVSPDFVVELPQEDPQDDSDIDLRTGEVVQRSWSEPLQFTFSSLSVLEDHQRFAQEVLKMEPGSWDRARVESNPTLFYQAYFLDRQKISEVRQKGTVRIQQFNVKVTRQSPDKDHSTSSRANRERLEAKFRLALNHMYQAFEEAFQYESSEFITDLRNHLVKTAVTHISSLFASSRCRTCHKGRRMDAVWRLRRFESLLPYLAEVPLESYRRAEDYRANVLLDKTALIADGSPMDKYQLGLTSEDRKLYATLTPAERRSFDAELKALANNNNMMRMSRRWENCKDASPALDINLGHQSFQKMRQLRRLNLLPVAQMLLHRYYDRHVNLIDRFGRITAQK